MSPDWIGKTIGGRYQIETLLGQGGMSAVYRATDPNLRRTVAIKLIHPHLSGDPAFVDRFKEEAAAVARLRHPNIVQVHDFNADEGTYYMVMEYLVGETLQARLKRLNAQGRFMAFDQVVALGIQLCEAFGYAHSRELVHRDIKPANIMLDVHGQAIVMDFGIVKIIGGDYHTSTGATVGTAMYMSPEQIRSERVDERADIYSLGVTLYEMISGRPPYMADSALTVMMMAINDPLPDLREFRPGIPTGLLAVVQQALAKMTGQRFQSMADMAAALRQVQKGLAENPPGPEAATEVGVTQPETIPAAPAEAAGAKTELPGTHPALPHLPVSENAPAEGVTHPEYPLSGNPIPTEPTVQEVPAQAVQAPARPAGGVLRLFGDRIVRRVFLAAAGLLIVAVAIFLILRYLNYRKPPDLALVPINLPAETLTIETAQAAVNLGIWKTDSSLEALAFSPDGRLLGTANNRDWVRNNRYRFYSGLWQVQAGSLQDYQLGYPRSVYDVAFSSDGQLLGVVSEDGGVRLWGTADNRLARKLESEQSWHSSLAFSPNNLLLAAGAWGGVDLWDIQNGNLLRSLPGPDVDIEDVTFSPDGVLLAGAAGNGLVLVWRINDGSLLYTLQEHTGSVYKVAFSPDNARLASASEDKTILLWQVSDGTLLNRLAGHSEAIYDVAFSPDGSLLASAGGDGSLRLWRVSDGSALITLIEYSDSMKRVAFSPDGRLLVSAAGDGTLQFWGISQAIPVGNK